MEAEEDVIQGTAIATMLSNVIAMTYFIFLLYKNRERTVIRFSLRNYSLQQGVPKEIPLVGLPGFVMMLMGILPLIGYKCAANKWKRMRSVIKTAFIDIENS